LCDVGRFAVIDCLKVKVFLHLYLLFYFIYNLLYFDVESRRKPFDSRMPMQILGDFYVFDEMKYSIVNYR